MTESNSAEPLDGIAIVGIAGRFPGSRNCDEFWQNLREGREGLTFFTDEELEAVGCVLGPERGKRVRSRGVVDDAELFDAAFFGYTPREAEIMDPQQRVFLEVAWTALENAGLDPDRVPGAVGVFAGASINTYYPTNVVSRPDVLGPFGVFPAVALNEKDFLATRVAYKLNLRGPAISVQTACSTSLVAVCNACQSLLSYESDIALAGGVAINFPQCHSYIHEEGGMISADGHCRPFDKNATGTLFSDGVGVVALRRLEDAVASGDTILAVIKGYALNNDGSDKAGFTAPSVNGQAAVIQMAHAFGDVEPDSISYVEAHGTATPLGDPIEIAGLTQAFRAGTDASQYCAIGSVKSNIGHLDVAAGIAGLIKTVLALKHREIPPTIHFTGPNPNIDFSSTPFYVVDKLAKWESPTGVPRRAGVSSFGIGGTNAHVVLEDAPQAGPSGESRPYQLLPLSARTSKAVDAATANLAEHLAKNPEMPLADVAYTLQVGRYQFNQRRVLVCKDRSEALKELGVEPAQDHPTLTPARHNPPVVFMFPGQGAQRVNMGRDLYESEPLYREIVDACAQILIPELDQDLRGVLFPAPDKLSWAEEQIVQTRITQPALFVTEYALAQLWMSWGIQPSAMIGHSVGEYVAACLAGVFSLEDGLRLIAARGRLIQEQPTGTMLAVMAGEDDVRPLLVDGVSIATINAPTLCVVSGPHDNIAAMESVLADARMECRPLHTSHAFHSAMMEPVVPPFTKMLEGVQLNPPQLPFVSNLTAAWINDDEATDPSYWAQQLVQAVRFTDGATVILEKADQQVFLEVGPGATLTSLTRLHPSKKSMHVVVPSLASAIPGQQPDSACVLSALGRLWQAGIDVNWEGFYRAESRLRVPLPSYPFERKRYFIEPGHVEYLASSSIDASKADVSADEQQREFQTDVESLSPRERILTRLYESLHALSGLSREEMGVNRSFMEMGFDSLLLSRACSAIDVEFGVPITFRKVAEELSTISLLADYLESVAPEENQKETGDKEPVPALAIAAESAIDTFLPMVDAQHEIWLAAQLDEDVSRTYNESRIIRVRGALKADVLRESLQELVDRHDALRATFVEDGSGQTIAGHLQVKLAIESLGNEQQLDDLVRASINELFDLAAGPLFRFSLYDLGEDRWAVLLTIHHLIADGWSWAVLLEELGEVYTAKAEGNAPPVRAALQFSDYVAWTETAAQCARIESAEDYWLELLADKPEEMELPSDRPRPSRKTYESGRISHAFDKTLLPRLKQAARQLDCTVFQLLTASFYAWLHRVTGRDDLVVAIPNAGQVASGLNECRHGDRLVGHSVNMLPVRLSCKGQASMREFVQQTKTQLLKARDHQDISFHNLINKLQWPRNPSRVPLASASLNFGRAHQVQFKGLDTVTQLPPKAYNFFDLTADMLEGTDSLIVDCKFNSDLFDASTVERWLSQWERMLSGAAADPDTTISNQEILTKKERDQLQVEWNATECEFPRDAYLHQLMEHQVKQVPEKVAVVCNGATLTYSELDQRANQFAHSLRERGIKNGQHIGVCVERSTDMLAAVLGILKVGAAYVPLDPSFPEERLRFMVEDAELALIISTTSLVEPFRLPRELQLLLDADAEDLSAQSNEALASDAELDASPEDPAYVIYTSGSTGEPKGVVVPHRAVVNFLTSMAREPGLTAEDVLLAVTTLSFDISVLELLLPLSVGATVVIASRDESVDGHSLKKLLEANSANIMQATPVTWRLLLEAGWIGGSAFKALVGGEALPRDLADQLIENHVELWNMYGPTETTVWSTCDRVRDTTNGITIGKPIANTTIYILDAQKNLCPIGVPGELYIGGDGVTLGYWKRLELTDERYIPDPFSTASDAFIYGTGDNVRWLNDGTLEHLGRLDNQVKVRGFRIELGDIETHIVQHSAIQEAVVVAREYAPGDQRLIAYFVAENSPDDLVEQLRAYLLDALPEYMVPAHFIPLDKLPRTNNGKLNRKALPAFDFSASRQHTGMLLPTTETEKVLAEIWAEVLRLEQVGTDENFFELGGHSLLAMQVGSRIRQTFLITLPLRDFVFSPTISSQSVLVDGILGESQTTTRIAEVALWASSARPSGLTGDREEIVL